jgi:hypothetical protein
MISVSAVFVMAMATLPGQMAWPSALLVAIGLGASGLELTAAVRALAALEYATLFAVIPVACWVGGVYAMVRGTQSS